jgi:hypothetical protein
MVDTQTPLNMNVRCMFCGGFAAREARRAPCTAKDETENKKKRKISNEERHDIEWKLEKARLT